MVCSASVTFAPFESACAFLVWPDPVRLLRTGLRLAQRFSVELHAAAHLLASLIVFRSVAGAICHPRFPAQ